MHGPDAGVMSMVQHIKARPDPAAAFSQFFNIDHAIVQRIAERLLAALGETTLLLHERAMHERALHERAMQVARADAGVVAIGTPATVAFSTVFEAEVAAGCHAAVVRLYG